MSDKSNHYAGWEIIVHEWSMRAKMFMQIGIVLGVLQIAVAGLIARFLCSAEEWALAWRYTVAKLGSYIYINPVFSDIPGISGTIPGKALLASSKVAALAGSVFNRCLLAFFLSFSVLLLWPVFLRFSKKRGDAEMHTKHLRGMQLIDEKELAGGVKKEKGLIPFGPIKLPRRYESEHIFIGGKPRVGKSVMAKQQIHSIRQAGHRAAIGDFKGEYTELFYNPETDYILNPLDARGSNWQLFSEINNKADLNGVCDSLIPDSTGDDRFWSAAAKAVFRGILAGLHNRDKKSNSDIWQACTSPIEDIATLCKSTPSGAAGYAYIQDASSKQAAGVIAVMMSYVSWLEFAQNSDGPELSTTKFLESDGAFLFLTGRPEIESTIRPMTGLFIDLLCRRILSLPDAEHDMQRKTYVYLDEFGNLQKLPSIIRFATAAGSKAGVLCIAIQDFAAIQKTYGKEAAETLFNACGSTAIFNVADPATSEYFSKRFGRREYEYARKNYQMSSQESRDSLTLTRDTKIDELVLPSEIQMLPKLQAYLKIPEHNPALITLDIQEINNRKAQHEAFIMRTGFDLDYVVERQDQIDQAASVWKSQKQVEEEVTTGEGEAETQTESTTQTEQPHRNEVAEIYSGF